MPGAEWTSLAHDWPTRQVSRETDPGHWLTDVVHPELQGKTLWQTHLVCAVCDQSVICLNPDQHGPGYVLTAGQIMSGVLAHIRRCHEDATRAPIPVITC
jgi:hypothetical protein